MPYRNENYEVYSSLRLENFRDGVEDYDYLSLLKSIDSNSDLLEVPIVTDFQTFTANPAEIAAFRQRVGEALDANGRQGHGS